MKYPVLNQRHILSVKQPRRQSPVKVYNEDLFEIDNNDTHEMSIAEFRQYATRYVSSCFVARVNQNSE